MAHDDDDRGHEHDHEAGPVPGGPGSPLDADAVRDLEDDPGLDGPEDDAATDDDARTGDLDPSEG